MPYTNLEDESDRTWFSGFMNRRERRILALLTLLFAACVYNLHSSYKKEINRLRSETMSSRANSDLIRHKNIGLQEKVSALERRLVDFSNHPKKYGEVIDGKFWPYSKSIGPAMEVASSLEIFTKDSQDYFEDPINSACGLLYYLTNKQKLNLTYTILHTYSIKNVVLASETNNQKEVIASWRNDSTKKGHINVTNSKNNSEQRMQTIATVGVDLKPWVNYLRFYAQRTNGIWGYYDISITYFPSHNVALDWLANQRESYPDWASRANEAANLINHMFPQH